MKHTLTALIATVLMVSAAPARAEDEPGAPKQSMRTDEPRLRLDDDAFFAAIEGGGRFALTDAQLGLTDNAQFRGALRMRLAGIIITSISLSATTAMGIISLWARGTGGGSDAYGISAGFGMLAGFCAIPTLAGVPLWVAGQSTISRLRAERRAVVIPRISFAATSSGAAVGAMWRF